MPLHTIVEGVSEIPTEMPDGSVRSIMLGRVLKNGFYHPSEHDWRHFLAGDAEPHQARRMSRHLDRCRFCLEVVDHLPPPTYYSLGRPLRPAFILGPAEVAEQVDALTAQFLERIPFGGAFVLASDWITETSLYLILSLSTTRLTRLGHSVAVYGTPFREAHLPVRRDVDVAILLEAAAFDCRAWSSTTKSGRLNVLVGAITDWNEPVDFVLRPSNSQNIRLLFEAHCSALRRHWRTTSDIAVRRGLLFNALGVDCPPGFFSSKSPPGLFLRIETLAGDRTDWLSVEGQWLAWEAVRDLVTLEDMRDATESLERFPALATRLRSRINARGFDC